MADGKIHLIHNILVAGVTTGFGIMYGLPLQPFIFSNIAGVLFTPDMDMESKTHSEVMLAGGLARLFVGFSTKKRIHKVERFFASIIMSITAPYAFFFPHRSWLTHLPPFSVIVQLLYFYGVYFCLCKIFDIHYQSLLPYYENPELLLTQFNVIIFTVLNLHHFAHLIGDGGMIIFFGKKYYIFSKPFYNLSRKLFPQSKRD